MASCSDGNRSAGSIPAVFFVHFGEDSKEGKALDEGTEGRSMLGAGCTVSDAPLENIHAAVYAAHHRNAGK